MWMLRTIQEKERMGRNAFCVWSVSGTAQKTLYEDRKGKNGADLQSVHEGILPYEPVLILWGAVAGIFCSQRIHRKISTHH